MYIHYILCLSNVLPDLFNATNSQSLIRFYTNSPHNITNCKYTTFFLSANKFPEIFFPPRQFPLRHPLALQLKTTHCPLKKSHTKIFNFQFSIFNFFNHRLTIELIPS